jgi:hypothetical protein
MSQSATPSSPLGASGEPSIPSEPRHPILLTCSRLFDAFKGGNNCEVLQAFDELQSMELEEFPEFRTEVLSAWGRGILTAAQMCSDDVEHLQEMLDDYEGRFNTPSPFLRALMIEGSNPAEVLQRFFSEQPPPSPTADDEVCPVAGRTNSLQDDVNVVDAQLPPLFPKVLLGGARANYIIDAIDSVTEKFRNFSCQDAVAVMSVASQLNVLHFFPTKLIEKLQRPYIARMKSKTEDVELVFTEMMEAGLKPVNAFPFTFVFMKPQPTKPLLDHYYLNMLTCGIKPMDSTLRVLLRNPSLTKEEHFFVKRRLDGGSEIEAWYDKKLCQLNSIEYEGVLEDASRLVQCMIFDGAVPNKIIFNKIIRMAKNDPGLAEAWYKKMIDMGVQPNAATFTTMISLWKHHKLTDSVDRWIAEMNARGMQLDTANYVSLLEGYVKSSNRSRAQSCFKALLARGDTSAHVYNCIMSLGPFDWALGCLAAMLSDGFEPSNQAKETLVSLAKDDISNSIIDEIAAAGWRKRGILTSSQLVSPPRGTTPSLQDCMRLMMREMKMSDEDMKRRSELLTAEVDLAKRT